MAKAKKPNRYLRIIEGIFFSRYKEGDTEVRFAREDITDTSERLGIRPPKNLGDVLYSFRYRANLPDSVRSCAPVGEEWVILPVGVGLYAFAATKDPIILPQDKLSRIRIPDSTPGVIEMYALNDEQALLARVRYNRLVDVFTGVTCHSLQNHLRTNVRGMGQMETDELYVGIDQRGAHYILPVQAKGGRDRLNVVQIAQDLAVCESKFPSLICRPIGTQFMPHGVIAMFEFERSDAHITIRNERHYQLIPSEEMTAEDLAVYRSSAEAAGQGS